MIFRITGYSIVQYVHVPRHQRSFWSASVYPIDDVDAINHEMGNHPHDIECSLRLYGAPPVRSVSHRYKRGLLQIFDVLIAQQFAIRMNIRNRIIRADVI